MHTYRTKRFYNDMIFIDFDPTLSTILSRIPITITLVKPTIPENATDAQKDEQLWN